MPQQKNKPENNRTAQKRYTKAHPERVAKHLSDWYQERGRDQRYQKKYGITLADYNRLFHAQHGKCAFCNKPQTAFKNRLNVDHNHKKQKGEHGFVRGLLCFHCNKYRIGRVTDYRLFERAAAYLKNPPSVGVLYNV